MQLGILKTDGGPHPPDKWARATARLIVTQLVDIDENSSSPQAVAVRAACDELEGAIRRLLLPHHTGVQHKERGALKKEGDARLSRPLRRDPKSRDAAVAEHADVDAIVEAVAEAAKVHPVLFEHFSKDHVKDVVRERLRMDFATVMIIERGWHADGFRVVEGSNSVTGRTDFDAKSPHVRAFRERGTPAPHESIDTSPKLAS